jgi:hypothetical protein
MIMALVKAGHFGSVADLLSKVVRVCLELCWAVKTWFGFRSQVRSRCCPMHPPADFAWVERIHSHTPAVAGC